MLQRHGALETTCLAADHLLAIAKAAGTSPVCLEKRTDELLARYEAGRASLPLVPPDEFPEPRPMEGGSTLVVPAGALPAAVAKVLPCTSKEATKYYLTGARLRVVAGRATLCATDAHRLSKVALPGVAEGSWPDAITPRLALELIGGMVGEVTLRLSDGLIRAESAGLTVTARLLEGPYPDVEPLIPTAAAAVFSCAASGLKAALERVVWAIDGKAAAIVGLKLAPGLPGLIWATQGAAKAEATFACDATRAFEVGFAGRFLLELCGYAKAEQLTLHQATPTSPALVVGAPGDVLVIMPCRIPPYVATMEYSDG